MSPKSPKCGSLVHLLPSGAVVLGLLVLPLLAACSLLPFANGRDSAAPGVRPGWKIVAEKVEPSYLIATDRWECFVSEERFEEVEPGDRIFCAWSDGTP